MPCIPASQVAPPAGLLPHIPIARCTPTHQRPSAQAGLPSTTRRRPDVRVWSQQTDVDSTSSSSAAAAPAGGPASEQAAASAAEDPVPQGCARYSVTLGKPLGLVLEENKEVGSVVVVEVLAGGNAERAGVITPGDTLVATTGYTRTTAQQYGEITVRGGERVVRLNARGETFDTVMAAIGSHPAHVQVTLEFQRCET